MAYEVPGRAERVPDRIASLWNQEIKKAYEAQSAHYSRFFALDPGTLTKAEVTDGVTWPADPLEPTFCADDEVVRELCDWGSRGRHALHNEYCEYAVLHADDKNGRRRPKRIQVTTELREYWLMLATHDPGGLVAAAADTLGREPSPGELYGVTDRDPAELSQQERRRLFAIAMAGHGNEHDLEMAGVPAHPTGKLNTENALFMSHPINGLDDLLFIVLFGARRFAVRGPDGVPRRAEKEDIFAAKAQRALTCRHADPAAALAAYGEILGGRAISFANPLGVYIRPFNHSVLEFAGNAIPTSWVRWSRGEEGMFQRLEVGPGDDDDAFLDDIELLVGQERQRLTGGHQLIRMLEVGPLLATGETSAAREEEFSWIPVGSPVECQGTGICTRVIDLERERKLAGEKTTMADPRERLMPDRTLQEGIFHAPGERPGKFFALMFLRARGRDARSAADRLADLWDLYGGLKQGRIPDLGPATVPTEEDNLQVLLGFGPGAFELAGAPRHKPDGLEGDRLFGAARKGGGGPLLAGSGLAYAPDASPGLLTEEFCIQATGDTKLAVDRTIVETWKRLSDLADPETGTADLELSAFYLGAQRSDRRSWIDFHDGISNMRSEERESAITVDAREGEEWCAGGTYLAFLRLAVDLAAWRRLSRSEQELLVGRDKLSGCPIVSTAAGGRPVADPGCPVAGTQIWEAPNDPLFAEPPRPSDSAAAQSHVQRANHHGEGSEPGSRRIFRQGYEFLEWKEGSPGFRAGLNFVSFQDTPERLTGMLTSEGWLGRVNFGGDPDRQPVGMESMLSVYAAGLFLVPARHEGELFPGAGALGF